MGTYSYWNGGIELSRKLTEEEANYLRAYLNMRHDMVRDVEKWLEKNEVKLHEIAGIEPGKYGEMIADDYVSTWRERQEDTFCFSEEQPVWYERPAPGVWCDWELADHLESLEAPSGEGKHYNMEEWLKFLIQRVFKPWGVVLTKGEISFHIDEDGGYNGVLYVKDNMVEMVYDKVTPASEIGPSWDKTEHEISHRRRHLPKMWKEDH